MPDLSPLPVPVTTTEAYLHGIAARLDVLIERLGPADDDGASAAKSSGPGSTAAAATGQPRKKRTAKKATAKKAAARS